MHITRLSINNLIGIGALEIEPGAVTEITGRNGQGKSSILEALQIALAARGQRSHPIREGADCAMIVVELDNGMVIERRLREGKGGDLRITQGRATLSKPQALLTELFGSAFVFNPVEFLELTPKAQTDLLLGLVELDLPAEELKALGDGKLPVEYHPDLHPLKALKLVEDELFNERQGVNREAKQKREAAAGARGRLPEGFKPGALAGVDLRGLASQLAEAQASNQVRGRLEREIAEMDAKIAELREARALLAEDLAGRPLIDTAALEEEVASYEERQQAQALYDRAQEDDVAAQELERQAEHLTACLEAVRAKPAELLTAAAPPVEGMGLGEDGLVTIHGRALIDFSDSEREELAVTIAEALAGELRVVCVDGLEKFDPARRAALLERLQADGMQVFVTTVTDGPLAINGVPVEAVA